MRLQDKVVVVTGSCTGIGKAIARRCVAEGGYVVVHGLQQQLGDQLRAELGESRAALHIEDIANEGCPERLVSLATERFGRLDAIVNNAASTQRGNIHNTDLNVFEGMLAVNVLAPFRLIKAGLRSLKAHGGCVLNIGSTNGYGGEPNLLPYSVSKGALMTMTRNLGDSLFRDEGVRVNQINPGWVLTESEVELKRQDGLADDWYERVPKAIAPAGRLLLPEEVAAAAIYWLSNECGPVSGQVVDVAQHPATGRILPVELQH